MKLKSLYLTMLSICFLFFPGCDFNLWKSNQNLSLTIVHTNDLHGRICYDEENKVIGFDKIESYVNELKSQNKNVVLMDAGDVLHGQPVVTFSKGENAVNVMNIMGYNYFAPGNHDFNYGYNHLLDTSKKMNFKVLSANITNKLDEKLFDPNDIFEVDGVKIGVFGLTTPETPVKTNPQNVEGIVFKDVVEAAQDQVQILKHKGADVIIALTHLGIDKESEGSRSYDVRDKVDGIDLIIDGHSHSSLEKINQVEGRAVITSAGAYGEFLGVTEISINNGQKTIVPKNIGFEELKNRQDDKKVASYLANAENELAEILKKDIGETKVYLEGSKSAVRTKETNLTKLATQAIKNETGADVVLLNGGGFRDSIKIGKITIGDVLKVFPFSNYVVTKLIKGSDLLKALEFGFNEYPNPSGKFPQLSGAAVTLKQSASGGDKINSVKINDQNLNLEQEYLLATNDFIASGGDGYEIIKNCKEIGQFSALEEVFINYIFKISPIS